MTREGEIAERGTYRCRVCGEVITVDEETEKLPPCPNYDNLEWEPAGRGGRF